MPVPVSFRQRGPPALLPLFKPLGVDGAGVVGIEAIGKRVPQVVQVEMPRTAGVGPV